jgi:hypothetical protein
MVALAKYSHRKRLRVKYAAYERRAIAACGSLRIQWRERTVLVFDQRQLQREPIGRYEDRVDNESQLVQRNIILARIIRQV